MSQPSTSLKTPSVWKITSITALVVSAGFAAFIIWQVISESDGTLNIVDGTWIVVGALTFLVFLARTCYIFYRSHRHQAPDGVSLVISPGLRPERTVLLAFIFMLALTIFDGDIPTNTAPETLLAWLIGLFYVAPLTDALLASPHELVKALRPDDEK